MSSKRRIGFGILAVLVVAAPAAGQSTNKASPGFDIVWQGDGGRFIEVSRKESRNSITLTLQAHDFNHHRRDGLLLATSALDQVTTSLTEESRRQPKFRDQRIAEVKRRDRTFGRIMTRTVDFLVVEEEKVLAAEKKRREEAERDFQRKKEAAERAERDFQRKKDAAEDAEKDRQRKRETAQEAERDLQRQREAAERADRERPPAAVPARPLPVQVLPGQPHQLLQGGRAFIQEGRLTLEVRTDVRNWPVGACWPLVLAVRNGQGSYLGRFATRDQYTADAALYRRLAPVTEVPTVFLTPTGNQLVFELGNGLADQAASLEVGFVSGP